jgi:hypothetical protein
LYLLKQPKVWGLALGFGSYNYTFYLLLAWLPSYLSTALHIDLFHSVLYTSVPWLFAAVVDLGVGGVLVDTLIQRGWNPVRVRQAVLGQGIARAIQEASEEELLVEHGAPSKSLTTTDSLIRISSSRHSIWLCSRTWSRVSRSFLRVRLRQVRCSPWGTELRRNAIR